MLTILQELNIDCFQGYGNSCCKAYHKANNSMPELKGSDNWGQSATSTDENK